MMYKIEYPEKGFVQYKKLISHSVWEQIISIKDDEERSAKLKQLGLFFTDKSPLFEAITTGILDCNGQHKCIVSKQRMKVRKECHTRCSFAYTQGEKWLKRINHSAQSGNIFSCKGTIKYLQARRIYIHYQNEFQFCQELSLSK